MEIDKESLAVEKYNGDTGEYILNVRVAVSTEELCDIVKSMYTIKWVRK